MRQTGIAIHIADRYISMIECTGGYDYTICDEDFRMLDDGVYDNPDITIQEAMNEVISDLKAPKFSAATKQYFYDEYLQGNVREDSKVEFVDFNMVSKGLVDYCESRRLFCRHCKSKDIE